MSEPTQPPLQGPQGDAMDVDPPPSHLPSPSSAPEGLPFPGKLVGGVHEVEHQDIGKLRFVDLRDLCGNYGLPKTGNKAALTERLTTFSADRKAWDGLVPSAHNKHRGPRDGGVAKDAKKKGSTKQSTLRRELLFGDTADGTGSTTGPCLPAEWSKDPRTDEERRDLLAWADRCVERNSHHGPTHPLYKPPPADTTAPAEGHTGNTPTQPAIPEAGSTPTQPVGESPGLAEQLSQLEARFEELMKKFESVNGAGLPAPSTVATSSTIATSSAVATLSTVAIGANAVTEAPPPTSAVATSSTVTIGANAVTEAPPPTSAATTGRHEGADRGLGGIETMVDAVAIDRRAPSAVTLLQVAASTEQPLTSATPTPDPLECLELANGRVLRFSKQSVPDPPAISFAKDIPRLVKMWDDGAPGWDPSEAVLRIQGEPIALKHWPLLYRYGKANQWKGTKKNWAKWEASDIVTSWQTLTEAGFRRKFSTAKGLMPYTEITKILTSERMAADSLDAKKAREEYGDRFDSVFTYRRGSEYIVRSTDVSIAKHYRTLKQQAE